MKNKLKKCPDCGVMPGGCHQDNCDVERCSVCGGQYMSCACNGHDHYYAKWTGIWPGEAESKHLGVDLNTFHTLGYHRIFFVKAGK